MAAPVIETVSTKNWGSSTNIVITKPVSLAEGDLMLAITKQEDNTFTITPPADWTTIDNFADGNSGMRIAFFWKTATAGDAAATDFTFTGSGATATFGFMYRISGHNTTTPIAGKSSALVFVTPATTTPSYAGGFTPTSANCLFFIDLSWFQTFTASGYAIATNNPASWTEQYDQNNGGAMSSAGASATRPEATASGNFSATLGTSRESVGFMFAVQAPQAAASSKDLSLLGVGS